MDRDKTKWIWQTTEYNVIVQWQSEWKRQWEERKKNDHPPWSDHDKDLHRSRQTYRIEKALARFQQGKHWIDLFCFLKTLKPILCFTEIVIFGCFFSTLSEQQQWLAGKDRCRSLLAASACMRIEQWEKNKDMEKQDAWRWQEWKWIW